MKIETGTTNVVKCTFSPGDWNHQILEIDLNPIDLNENLLLIQIYRNYQNMIAEIRPLVRIHNNIIMITKPTMSDPFGGFVSIVLLSPVV